MWGREALNYLCTQGVEEMRLRWTALSDAEVCGCSRRKGKAKVWDKDCIGMEIDVTLEL